MRRITLTIALSVFFLLFPVLNAGHAQSADESTVLQLVNAERTSRGLQAYAWDSCLAAAATDHNNDMINNNFFDHTGSDGSSATDRANRRSYPTGHWVGENIAFGYTTPASVVTAWMNSSGHRAAILDSYNAGHTVAGVSRVGNHWTINFGPVACSGGTTTTGTTTGSTTGGSTTTGSTTGGTGTTTGSTTTGTTTGGATTGSTTTGSTTGGTGTTTGTTTGGTTTGTTTGGTSTGGTTTGTTSGGSSSGSSTGNSSGGSSTTANTTNNVPDDCQLSGGSSFVVAQGAQASNVNCTTLSVTGVGNQWVIDQGFIRAVDVWGNFSGDVEVCLIGSGSLIFMDAAGAPRVPVAIASFSRNGMTCAVISTPGSVILVGTSSGTVTQPASTTTTQSVTTVNTDGSLIHIVQPGENLFRIGLRYGVPFQQIAAVNGIGSDYRIFVGQQLIIPQ